MTLSTGGQQVKELLLGLPVVKEENISSYRQTMVSAESHPSMFIGSTDETAEFVAQMAAETERFIRSSQGIARVEKQFLMNKYRLGEQILEIQYQQFWNNGSSSIYSEHVMRIGQDQFEVFGSTSSAARMEAFRASLEKGTDSPKSLPESDNNGEKVVVIGKWNFTDEIGGFPYNIIFNRDGTLIHTSDASDTKTIGRWSQDGTSIHFEVGSYSVGDGKVVGEKMTGSTSNTRGKSWMWEASRDSEPVKPIAQDKSDGLGSTPSASKNKAPRATSGKSTASIKSFTDQLTNKKALGFILLVAGILLTGVSSLLSLIITIGALYILLAEFKPGMRNEIKILISIVAGFVILFIVTIVAALI